MMKHNFKKLTIWKRSMHFVKEIYLITQHFPKEERYGLTSQIRRSAVSIPSNIAEGCGRGTDKDLSKFLDISIGSNCEAETQIIAAYMLDYLSKEDMNRLTKEAEEIRMMTIGFQKKNC